MDKVDVLRLWMEREGRKSKWLAEQLGVSRAWISYVLNRRREMSPRLTRAIEERLGISFSDEMRRHHGRAPAPKG